MKTRQSEREARYLSIMGPAEAYRSLYLEAAAKKQIFLQEAEKEAKKWLEVLMLNPVGVADSKTVCVSATLTHRCLNRAG